MLPGWYLYVLAVIEVEFLDEQYIWLYCCIHICTLKWNNACITKAASVDRNLSSVEGIMCSLEDRSLSSLQSQLAWRIEFKSLNGKGGKNAWTWKYWIIVAVFLVYNFLRRIFFRSRMPYFRPERLFHLLKNGHEFTNICGSTLILPLDSVYPFKV